MRIVEVYSRHITLHIIIPTREYTSTTPVGACYIMWDRKNPKEFVTESSPSAEGCLSPPLIRSTTNVLIEQLLLYTVYPDKIYMVSKATLAGRWRPWDAPFSSCIICKADQKMASNLARNFASSDIHSTCDQRAEFATHWRTIRLVTWLPPPNTKPLNITVEQSGTIFIGLHCTGH